MDNANIEVPEADVELDSGFVVLEEEQLDEVGGGIAGIYSDGARYYRK